MNTNSILADELMKFLPLEYKSQEQYDQNETFNKSDVALNNMVISYSEEGTA